MKPLCGIVERTTPHGGFSFRGASSFAQSATADKGRARVEPAFAVQDKRRAL
jgi:hypothetical protein